MIFSSSSQQKLHKNFPSGLDRSLALLLINRRFGRIAGARLVRFWVKISIIPANELPGHKFGFGGLPVAVKPTAVSPQSRMRSGGGSGFFGIIGKCPICV
jgi:hypothetical protein